MADSTTEQMPASVREWTEILARIRFGTVRIAGKNVAGSRIKLVAGRLANFADGNGSRVRPGIARLAVDLELDYRAVGGIVAYLRRIGLLGLVRSGKGVKADEYRLTLPVDLLDRDDLVVWSPSRQTLEIERVRETQRGGRKRFPGDGPDGPRGGGAHVPEGPVLADETHVPQGPVLGESTRPSGTGDATPSGVRKSASTRPSGGAAHVPQGQATHQDLDTTTTNHADGDLRTAVTGPRAAGAESTNRCPDHKMRLQPRTDGLNPCPLCRAGAPATPDRTTLAPVISLASRRIS